MIFRDTKTGHTTYVSDDGKFEVVYSLEFEPHVAEKIIDLVTAVHEAHSEDL